MVKNIVKCEHITCGHKQILCNIYIQYINNRITMLYIDCPDTTFFHLKLHRLESRFQFRKLEKISYLYEKHKNIIFIKERKIIYYIKL